MRSWSRTGRRRKSSGTRRSGSSIASASEHGYDGGATIVKDAVRAWKQRQAEVFVPLAHRPGEAQADFGEAQVKLRGKQIKVALFVMTLPHCDAFFCQAFPKECTEAFQEGHKRAFEFFQGVPQRISYDNSKIAVSKIVGGRGREATAEFLRLESHYLFAHHFCRVRRPNEKGHVENLVGYVRRNYLVPVPEVDGLEQLNADLAESCRKDLDRTLRGKTGSKAELLGEERRSLSPLPNHEFEARRIETAKANSLSLVRFDGNDYCVPTRIRSPSGHGRGRHRRNPPRGRSAAGRPPSAALGPASDRV